MFNVRTTSGPATFKNKELLSEEQVFLFLIMLKPAALIFLTNASSFRKSIIFAASF